MDADAIQVIGSFLIYYAGIFAAAFAWEVIRVILLGVMLYTVLRMVLKGRP